MRNVVFYTYDIFLGNTMFNFMFVTNEKFSMATETETCKVMD